MVDDPYVAELGDDSIAEDSSEDTARRERRHWWLLVIILVLLLLLCWVVSTVDILLTGGPQKAQFVARNVECLRCHTELIPQLEWDSVHDPFYRKQCTACHTPHGVVVEVQVQKSAARRVENAMQGLQWLPLRIWYFISQGSMRVTSVAGGEADAEVSKTQVKGPKSMLALPPEDLCWMCHGSMGALLEDEYQHPPFSDGSCVTCHKPHASRNESLLVAPAPELCFTCHQLGTELARAQVHPPAGKGWCTDCHSPHASDWKGMLVKRQRELCFDCHPRIGDLNGLAVRHQPFVYDQCTGCHEPHGSDAQPLLVRYQPGLCYGCHPSVSEQFGRPSAHPVGLELVCADCHDPHAADYSALLTAQDNKLCYQCHRAVKAKYERSRHRTQLCVKCHTPHGSDFSPILVGTNPDLCFRCHTGLTMDNRHPIQPIFFDTHAGTGLTCTSTCHDPHGTPFGAMVKKYPFTRDGVCLQCHKTVGIYY